MNDMRFLLTTVPAWVLAAAPVWAQCSMCRTAAAAQGPEAARAMNTGVLLLLTPAVALFTGIFALAFLCARGRGAEEHTWPWKK